MYKCLVFLLFSFSVMAQEKACNHEHGLITEDLSQLIEWFGASTQQIISAPCKTLELPSNDEMLDFIAKSHSLEKSSLSIHDVQFKDESKALLNAFEALTTAKDSFGISYLPENQVNIQEKYKINPNCDKVLCGIKKIWGEAGIKMLYIKLKYGFNTSEITFKDSARFEKKELDDVLLALKDLPEHLTGLARENQRLTKFTRGFTLAGYGPSATANSFIMLFDAWSVQPEMKRQYTIFHESGHNISRLLGGLDSSASWLKISSWNKKGDDWTSERGCFVSEYGQSNPVEDFAESVTAYRYNGKAFQERCPKKYNFIKSQVFKGLEYTSAQMCEPPSEEKLSSVKDKILKSIMNKQQLQTVFSTKDIMKICEGSFTQYPLTQEEVARCSLNIQFQEQLKLDLENLLKDAGLEDNQINKNKIQQSLVHETNGNKALVKKINETSSSLINEVDKIIENSLPKKIDNTIFETKTDFIWHNSGKKCGRLFFKGTKDEMEKCQIEEAILSYPRYFPSLELPSTFSAAARADLLKKHHEEVTKLVLQKEQMQIILSLQKNKFIDDMNYHRETTEIEIKRISGWNKMSAMEFCKKTYVKSSYWLKTYGLKDEEPIPGLLNECISAQSKKTKRFTFSKQEWEELLK